MVVKGKKKYTRRKGKKKYTRKKGNKRKVYKKQKGGIERAIVPVNVDKNYLMSLPIEARMRFLHEQRENDPESFMNLMQTIMVNPGPVITRPVITRPIIEPDVPLQLEDIYPEFDDQLERKYVWETDNFNQDFTPENLDYENCRRLQDYCELFPRKCYLNRDYLERLVKPCQEVKKTQLLINKFMNGYQFIPDLHEHTHQGDQDTRVDIEYETEEIITDMYNNRYPGIVPTDELGPVSAFHASFGQPEESPPRRARRLRRYRAAAEGLKGNIPNYVLNNTLNVYLQRIDIPDDIKRIFQKIIYTFELDQESLYGENASITDFLGNLRMIERTSQYNSFPGFIEYIRNQFKYVGHYSDLEVQQFVNKILQRLTDLIV